MGYSRLKSIAIVTGLMVCTLSIAGCGKKDGTKEPQEAKGAATVQKQEALVPSSAPITDERTYYNFEAGLQGWEIPLWSLGKSDYVAKAPLISSSDVSSKGASSMQIMADFPGGMWSAALVEIEQYLDLSRYRVISFDVFVPEDCPVGLKTKTILTVGDNWKFIEMSQSIPLVPGEWTTVSANIEPGSYDWKRVVPDEKFAQDVRKISIRVESNRKPKYAGPIYIDNVRVGR